MLIVLRLLICFVGLVPSIVVSQEVTRDAAIAGRVTDKATGRPIAGARVTLTAENGQQKNATSDEGGVYQFRNVAYGKFVLDAEAPGFLRTHWGGVLYSALISARPPLLTLTNSVEKRADIALIRPAAIEGFVLDEFGDGVANALVEVSELRYAAGRKRLVPFRQRGTFQRTDDRGFFRVYGLPPSSYFLCTLSGALSIQDEPGLFAPTCYPGTSDFSAATPLMLAPGQTREGIVMSLTPLRPGRISGTVIGVAGTPAPEASLVLSVADGQSDYLLASRAKADSLGRFDFRNVPPGDFVVQAFGEPPSSGPRNLGAAPFGTARISVTDTQEVRTTVYLRVGASLTGMVRSDAPNGELNPKDIVIWTAPADVESSPLGSGPPPWSIHEDGTFGVHNLFGRQRVIVSSRNSKWVVRQVKYGATDRTDAVWDFSQQSYAGVEVILTRVVASVRGHVMSEQQRAAGGCTVIVFPADARLRFDRSRFVNAVACSEHGDFVMEGLPSGDYFAIAVPSIRGNEWQDPELMAILEPRGTRFSLAEAESKSLVLKLAEVR